MVDITCHLYLQTEPWELRKTASVVPDGTNTFTCSWAGEYDLTPNDVVKVEYRTPDGHYVGQTIQAPRPAVRVFKYGDGIPGPGGNFRYHIEYENYGDAPAEDVVITDVMMGQTYLGSTAPVTPTGTGNGPIVWALGTLPPGARGHFVLFAHVVAAANTQISNTVSITTSNPYNTSGPWELSYTVEDTVLPANAQLRVSKIPYLWQPAPGQTFGYALTVCNDGDTSSAAVTLTDTLPPQTTLVGWWGDEPGWRLVSQNNNMVTFTYPTVGGHRCQSVDIRVRLAPSTPPGTWITNTVTLASSSPVTVATDSVGLEVHGPIPDLGVALEFISAMLTPGGEVLYQVHYGNYGNVDAVDPLQIVVTLPQGVQLAGAWRRAPGDWSTTIPITPVAQMGRDVVWEFPPLQTMVSSAFEFAVTIPPTMPVGAELLARARIQPLPGERDLINNVSKWREQVYAHGPNPRLTKSHEWKDGRQTLAYRISFENVGDVGINEPLVITDTLPAGVIVGSAYDVRYSYFTEIPIEVRDGLIIATLPYLPARANGAIEFEANLAEPGYNHWYTNTVAMTVPAGDANPADNVFTDVAFSGTGVEHVNLHWGWGHHVLEGHAVVPQLVLTTPSQVLTLPTEGGYFYVELAEPLAEGDVLTLRPTGASESVEIRIPDPYSVLATSSSGIVAGQVGTETADVWVEMEEKGYWHIWTEPNGGFSVNFGPVPRGARGFVKVETWHKGALVRVYRPFRTQDLLLQVNYAHDWVYATYARADVAATVNVNTGTGVYTVSGPMVVTYYGEDPYFFSADHVWTPDTPDIRPGHTVQATTSDGASTSLVVGTINASVDVNQDRLVGTVHIPATRQLLEQAPVRVECRPWDAPPGVETIVVIVTPNGVDTFTCSWAGVWDIQPGEAIAVLYEQDGNAVMNVFNEEVEPPAPDVKVTQVATPLPAVVDQALQFTLTVTNVGEGVASNVLLTNTLPVSMTFVSVSGPSCAQAGRLVTCQVGELAPGASVQALITVKPQAAGTFVNSARVTADGDPNPQNDVSNLTFMVVAAQQVRVFAVTPTSAPNTQETPIVVQGANFSTPATVRLINASAEVTLSNVTVVSAQELQATVPANLTPGTYHLVVSTASGGSDTLLNAFTVLSSAPPTLQAIAPDHARNVEPVLVDVYGTNLAPGLTAALRRTGQADTALLNIGYVNSTRFNARVPAGLPVGTYTLVITNPNGQSAQLADAYTVLPILDDLVPRENSFLLFPPSPRAGDEVSMTITVRRVGGTTVLTTVAVDFYVVDAAGAETYLGRGQTPALAPDSRVAVSLVAWRPSQAGTYTLRAVIDPTNAVVETFEDNNVITRTVEVLPALSRDVTPPTVIAFSINQGQERTTERQVYLNALATDNAGGSGVTHLFYIEYVLNFNTRQWGAVATSGWVPYAEASTAYPWELYPLPGVHYLQVWAADAAGNISQNAGLAFINWVPGAAPFAIAQDEVQPYLTSLQEGQRLTLRLTSVTGDADLYVWRATATGPVLVAASYLEDPVEEVSFSAPASGFYLIEVYGYATSTYFLDFITNGALRHRWSNGVILPSKGRGLPTSDPGLTPSSTTEEMGVPSSPVTLREYYLFLPVTLRGAR